MRGAVKPSGIDGGTLLQNGQFEAVAGIMRPAPEIMSADDAGTPAGQSAMSAEVDAQIKRIRDEITEAVDSVPGLTSQLKEDRMADGTAPAMTPEQAAENVGLRGRSGRRRAQGQPGAVRNPATGGPIVFFSFLNQSVIGMERFLLASARPERPAPAARQ